MKKKNKKNHMKMRFSTLLLCCLAIVLCAAPCAGVQYFSLYYDEVGEYDVTVDEINKAREAAELEKNGVLDGLEVGAGATVNLYTDVSQSVYVYPGGILNIYSGSVGLFVALTTGEQNPIVTVYGTNFAVDGVSLGSSKQFTVDGISGGVLTGTYGNNEPIPPGLYTLGLWFISSIPINLEPPAASNEVAIDIKPGGNPNNINPRSMGVVPVAVLTIGDFEASTVDPKTVEFAGAEPVRWRLCDVDGDRDDDLLFHFKTQDLLKGVDNPKGLDEDSTEATLTGEAYNGDVISGTDKVWIVPRRKEK